MNCAFFCGLNLALINFFYSNIMNLNCNGLNLFINPEAENAFKSGLCLCFDTPFHCLEF